MATRAPRATGAARSRAGGSKDNAVTRAKAKAGDKSEDKVKTEEAPAKRAPKPKGGGGELPKMELRRAGYVPRDKIRLKALVYGMSGVGKTHFASRASNVAVALLESQGFATIRDNHEHAIVVGEEGDEGTPAIRTMDQLRSFILMAKRGELAEAGITTIVLDSVTELQKMVMAEILGAKDANEDTLSKRDWGLVGRRMESVLRVIRDLPYNVIVTALCDWTYDEESGRRILAPLVKGSTAKDLAGYFNVVGLAYRRQSENADADEDDSVRRYILVDSDDRYASKPFGPLRGVVEPDFDLWLRVLADPDGEEQATIPGAPLPGTTAGRARKGVRFGGGGKDNDNDDKD